MTLTLLATWTRMRLIAAFCVLGLLTGLGLALLTPINMVADEMGHLVRAVALADGQIVGRRAGAPQSDGSDRVVSGVDVDPAIEAVDELIPIRDLRHRDGAQPPTWTGSSRFYPLHTIATYMPALYGPSGIAARLAKGFGASPLQAATAGRLTNLVVFLGLGALAIGTALQGRALIFLVLSVPMTLSLAASFSQDAFVIALGALAMACLTRVIAARREARRDVGALWGAGLALSLLIAAKPPYFPLAAAILLPLDDGHGVAWRAISGRLLVCVLVLLPGLLWAALVIPTIAAPIPRPPYEAGPLWPGPRPAIFTGTDPKAQLQVLLSRPLQLVYLPWRFLTSVRRATVLGEGLFGLLGWLDLRLYGWLYAAWLAALLAALKPLLILTGTAVGAPRRAWADPVLISAAIVATVWSVFLSQYLSWTNVGETSIIGPQGRYFLPVLPILALWPAQSPTRPEGDGTPGAWLGVLAAACGVVAVPALVAGRWLISG